MGVTDATPPLSLAALTILDAGPAGQIEAAAAAGFDPSACA